MTRHPLSAAMQASNLRSQADLLRSLATGLYSPAIDAEMRAEADRFDAAADAICPATAQREDDDG